MGTREARGRLEEAPLIRVTVDARLGRSHVQLLAAPYVGGSGPVDPRAPAQWGDPYELVLNLDARPRIGNDAASFEERIRRALASRRPPPEGCVFLTAARDHDLTSG